MRHSLLSFSAVVLGLAAAVNAQAAKPNGNSNHSSNQHSSHNVTHSLNVSHSLNVNLNQLNANHALKSHNWTFYCWNSRYNCYYYWSPTNYCYYYYYPAQAVYYPVSYIDSAPPSAQVAPPAVTQVVNVQNQSGVPAAPPGAGPVLPYQPAK